MAALLLALAGCFLTINHPAVGPDGSLALFLLDDGGYSLFPEGGVLHRLIDGEWIPIPAATLNGMGGVLDLSPDGTEYLYADTDVDSDDPFAPPVSRLYRVRADADAEPMLLHQSEGLIARAAWTVDGIVLLSIVDEAHGILERVHPLTGEAVRLRDGVISFHALEDSLIVIGAEPVGDLIIGRIGRWDPETDETTEFISFLLNESTYESFLLLPHRFFWDVSADGRWIALALHEGAVLDPPVAVEIPALYLVDRVAESSQRLAAVGLIPAFSPDGKHLAYLTSEDNETAYVMVRELDTEYAVRVPDTEGVQSLLWLGPDWLGVTYELDEDRASLVAIDVQTEERTYLLGEPPVSP